MKDEEEDEEWQDDQDDFWILAWLWEQEEEEGRGEGKRGVVTNNSTWSILSGKCSINLRTVLPDRETGREREMMQ